MTKEEIKFLMNNGFALGEILQIEQGTPAADPEPVKPAADPEPVKPAAEPESPPAPAAEPEPAKPDELAALKHQVEILQAQLLSRGTSQPAQSQKSIEDLVAAF